METSNAPLNLSGLSDYWQKEFQKIHDSNGTYKGKWNWWAFLFSWIWFFTKGAWLWAIIFIVLPYFIFKIDNPYIGLAVYIAFLLFPGRRGNLIYYNVKVNKKQMAM